jgi:hypothetical protein
MTLVLRRKIANIFGQQSSSSSMDDAQEDHDERTALNAHSEPSSTLGSYSGQLSMNVDPNIQISSWKQQITLRWSQFSTSLAKSESCLWGDCLYICICKSEHLQLSLAILNIKDWCKREGKREIFSHCTDICNASEVWLLAPVLELCSALLYTSWCWQLACSLLSTHQQVSL